MSKYEEAAAKALREAKDDCQHPASTRSVDWESGDDFCGDCGTVIKTYVPGTPRRFPGRKALDLITAQMKAEFPGELGEVKLFHVDPADSNEFDVLVSVTTRRSGTEHRYYTLTRTAADETVTVERRKP